METNPQQKHTPGQDPETEPVDQKSADNSSFYRKVANAAPENPGNRTEGSPKDINDPFYKTGSASGNVKPEDAPDDERMEGTDKKTYNDETNSGGSHSATDKQEN